MLAADGQRRRPGPGRRAGRDDPDLVGELALLEGEQKVAPGRLVTGGVVAAAASTRSSRSSRRASSRAGPSVVTARTS